MPSRIRPLQSDFIATMNIVVGESLFLNDTPAGWRRVDVFQGGTVVGPRLNGTILNGGSDNLLRRADAALQADVRLTIRTDDGAIILVTYRGVRHGPPDVMARIAAGEDVPPDSHYLRNAPFFETGHPKYDWLNRIVTVGVGRREPTAAVYDLYEIK